MDKKFLDFFDHPSSITPSITPTPSPNVTVNQTYNGVDHKTAKDLSERGIRGVKNAVRQNSAQHAGT